MLRTTIYLDEDIGLSIRKLAHMQGRPQSELIRDALRAYVEKTEEHSKLPPGLGQYRSGRSDVSAKADELLKKAAQRKR